MIWPHRLATTEERLQSTIMISSGSMRAYTKPQTENQFHQIVTGDSNKTKKHIRWAGYLKASSRVSVGTVRTNDGEAYILRVHSPTSLSSVNPIDRWGCEEYVVT